VIDPHWAALLGGMFGLLTATVVLLLTQRFERENRRRDIEWDERRRGEDRDFDERRWRNDREAEEQRWRLDRETAERRWYADRLIEQKFDACAKLHAALVSCRLELSVYVSSTLTTAEQLSESAVSKLETYMNALVLAEVYLTKEQIAVMERAQGVFSGTVERILAGLPGSGVNLPPGTPPVVDQTLAWRQFFEVCDEALCVMKSVLDPEQPDATRPLSGEHGKS
jgi:hypothetical protein